VIVLRLRDREQIEVSDVDARRLADLLWQKAEQGRTAVVAVAIHDALCQHDRMRSPIDVPVTSLERVDSALRELH
jgi:hypothetical protein